MSGAARPLQPATALSASDPTQRDSGSTSPGPGRGSGSQRQKRTLIESACSACRRRKSRCDGVRPSCSRCANLRTECHYEAEEGESRWSALRRRAQVLGAERDQLRELLAFLQSAPIADAMDVFRHIRASSFDDVVGLPRHIRDGTLNLPSRSSAPPLQGPSSADQRLPPIHSILNGPVPSAGKIQSLSLNSEESKTSSVSDLSMGSSHAGLGRPFPDTLEPNIDISMPPPLVSMSSEESTTSGGSMSLDQRPYGSPP